MSDQRLHPASILFDAARYARIFVWPALLAFFGGGRATDPLTPPGGAGASETWLWILMVPSVVLSVGRYLTFRVRYEPDALVIRSGILFRNVRHVPYARIQNLDAVQTVVHRTLGVVEVRIETGGGAETEARLSVLPRAALDEMRARVFAGREAPAAGLDVSRQADREPVGGTGERSEEHLAAQGGDDGTASARRTLLHLPLRELLLCGFLENKGMVLVGAAYGALWEAGALDRLWSWLFAGEVDARGLVREVAGALAGDGPLPADRLLMALAGVAAFFVLVRAVSMAWALVRLYDFTLERRGDDLRLTFGLFTRIAATIPRRRVQTLTIQQGWLHRRLGRASVRIETAGGPAAGSGRDREWVAPLVRLDALPLLVSEVMPGAAMDDESWQPVHPRAFRRAIKPALLVALLPSSAAVLLFGWPGAWLAAAVLAWAAVRTRARVRRLRWAASDSAVGFRSGWLTSRDTRVRTSRIQVVATRESPFDRRAGMARVCVDTAGGSELSHRIDIPYLEAEVGRTLAGRLAALAARTAFRW